MKYFLLFFILITLFACEEDDTLQIEPQLEEEVEEDRNPHFCITNTSSVAPNTLNNHDTHALSILRNYKWENGAVIKVGFLGGSPLLHDRVIQFAEIWEQYANIDFQFVPIEESLVRISFDLSDGHWSYIGTDILNHQRIFDRFDPTMNIALSELDSEIEFRRVVLHEFGHTLGLIHEHQHPFNSIQWDKDKVYDFYSGIGWSRSDVDRNIFNQYNSSETNFSQYDPESIMHYWISSLFTLDDFSVGENTELSDFDKCFINELYPFEIKHFNDYSEGGVVGDFNGDGKDDLLWFSPGPSSDRTIIVALSEETHFASSSDWGDFIFPSSLNEGWFAIGDFNGDGKDDVLKYSYGEGQNYVAISNGNSFNDLTAWGNAESGFFMGVGDFNGDGKDDLLYHDGYVQASGWISYYKATGEPKVLLSNGEHFMPVSLWPSEPDNIGFHIKKIGDFNGDDKDDLLFFDLMSNEVIVFTCGNEEFSNATTWLNSNTLGASSLFWEVGDFSGDGVDDILRTVTSDFGAAVALSTGTSFVEFEVWNNHETSLGWKTGDFNGDGKDDIMMRNPNTSSTEVYLSGGSCFPVFN